MLRKLPTLLTTLSNLMDALWSGLVAASSAAANLVARAAIPHLRSLGRQGLRLWTRFFKSDPWKTIIATFFFLPLVLTCFIALFLRIANPQTALLISPIEVPQTTSVSFSVTSGGVANVVVDEMLRIREARNDAIKSITSSDQTGAQNVVLFLRPSDILAIEPEILGFSPKKVAYYWNKLRQQQHVISGELAFNRDVLVLRGRINDEGASVEVGPFPATEVGLKNACQEFAINLLTALDPGLVGLFYLNKQEHGKSVEILRRWVELEPMNPEAQAYLGTALLYVRKIEEGISNLQAALSGAQRLSKGLRAATSSNLCAAFTYRGRLAEAQKLCDTALEISPEMPSALNNHGSILLRMGNLDGAIASYRKVLMVEPRFVPSLVSLAGTLTRIGKCDEAEATIVRFLGYQSNPGLMVAIGLAYECQGRHLDAIRSLERAIALDPKRIDAFGNTGVILGRAGQFDAAISYLNRGLELEPDSYFLLNNKCGVYGMQGNLEAACACANSAIKLRPDLSGAYVNLAVCLRGKGQLDDALAAVRKGLSLESNPEALNELGAILYLRGQRQEAIEIFRKVIALRPNLANSHASLGLALLNTGEIDQAIQSFNKAISLDPQHTMALWNLGVAFTRKGDVDTAQSVFVRTIATNPAYLRNLVDMGNTLVKDRDYDVAIRLLRQAIAIKADDAEAHYGLGKALEKVGKRQEAARELAVARQLNPHLKKN